MIHHQTNGRSCSIPAIPKVSVIVPVYNTEEYLCQCLDSILSQSLKEIEIICIDDGSSDSSLKILRKYQQKDRRIRIITQNNLGSGPSRNKGIAISTGEFIAFMDSDDWYPDKDILEVIYGTAIKKEVVICGGSAIMWKQGKVITKFRGANSSHSFNKEGFMTFSEYQYPWGYWRFLYKRSFLLEHNLVFPNYRRGQDPPFFVNAMMAAKKFYATSKVTYCYRVSHKKICWDTLKINDYLNSIIYLLNISQKNRYSKLYTFAIKRFCWTYGIYIMKGLDKNNKIFSNKITEYNEIIIKNNLFNELKKTPIDRYIIEKYSYNVLKCSNRNKVRKILSAIKYYSLVMYWSVRDRMLEDTNSI